MAKHKPSTKAPRAEAPSASVAGAKRTGNDKATMKKEPRTGDGTVHPVTVRIDKSIVRPARVRTPFEEDYRPCPTYMLTAPFAAPPKKK